MDRFDPYFYTQFYYTDPDEEEAYEPEYEKEV